MSYDHDGDVSLVRGVHHFEDVAEMADRVPDREGSVEVLALNINDQECSAHGEVFCKSRCEVLRAAWKSLIRS